VQAQEEQDHAMLFLQYMLNNGEKVTLDAIAAPDVPFEDFKAPLVAALEHEQYVTASINNIYEEASKQKDYRTMQFLGWFITEQEEEERNTGDLIQQYDLFASDGKGLYLMDSELAARVHTPPSLVLD
jgi:ferritin